MVWTDSAAGILWTEGDRLRIASVDSRGLTISWSKFRKERERNLDVIVALSIVVILSPLLFALLISADISLLTKIVVGAIGMFLLTCLPFLALLLGGYEG